MTESKHVSKLVSCKLYNSHQCPAFKFFISLVSLSGPSWKKTVDAVNATVSIAITKAKVAKIFGKEINISEADDTECVSMLSLNWTNEFIQNLNCVKLSAIEQICLCINSKSIQTVICLGIENNHLAWHIEGFHPFLEFLQHRFSDSRVFFVHQRLNINYISFWSSNFSSKFIIA